MFGCDPKVFTYSQPVRVPGRGRENCKVDMAETMKTEKLWRTAG